MSMTDSSDVTWDSPLGTPFDRAWADEKLAGFTGPFDVVAAHLEDEGSLDAEVFSWLQEKGCHPRDIGRFVKLADGGSPLLAGASDKSAAIRGFLSERRPVPPPDRVPDLDGRVRAVIGSTDPESRWLAKMAWDAIEVANDPPQMFTFGPRLAWPKATTTKSPVINELSKDEFGSYLHHRVIEWQKKDSNGVFFEVEPPDRVVKDMWANPHPPVPPLSGVRAAPVFSPSGNLAFECGYDAESQMFVWPVGLDVPFVPSHPTQRDVESARHLIEKELLVDFPFVDDASRSHAIAALLHPFVRPMIQGPTPLHLVDKPSPGTGAGFLVEAVTVPGLGKPPPARTVSRSEVEGEYKMTAVLRPGPIAVLLDNITQRLDSETIAAMITAPDIYEGRIVGSSQTVAIPVRCLWLATGNNVQVSHEMARRCVLIRLDAGIEHPEDRREFRHSLPDWAYLHRSELVWAALVLVQNWIAKGMLPGSKTKGSFESWARTIGGILEAAGIPGFLENTDTLRAQSDSEQDDWRGLVEAWWDKNADERVGARDLLSLAEAHLADLGEEGRSRSTAWGSRLRSKVDNVVNGKRIVDAGKSHGAAQYRLEPVKKG